MGLGFLGVVSPSSRCLGSASWVLANRMPTPTSISPEQRVQVVLALLRKDDSLESLESLARKAGVSATSLGRWRDEFVEAGKSALGAGKVVQNQLARQVESLPSELAGRDQVIGELTVAKRILKKRSARAERGHSSQNYGQRGRRSRCVG